MAVMKIYFVTIIRPLNKLQLKVLELEVSKN